MRTAVRSAIATAVMAGALIAPASGAAFAAASSAAPAAATASTDFTDGLEGAVQVDIAPRVAAVLGYSAKGPEARILSIGSGKPDEFPTRWITTLHVDNRTDQVNDVYLALVDDAKGGGHTLTVTLNGQTKRFPLPKRTPAPCVSEVKEVQVGAGMIADLTMSSKGPKAVVHGSAPGDTWSQTLDRTHPKGSDAFYVRIVNPSGAKPVFEWKTQGGVGVPVGKTSFPALPKGCELDYKVVEEGSGNPAPKPSTTPSTAPAAPKAQTAGQTKVVPQGPVAAGAELPVETVADGTDTAGTATVAAGAGLVVILAAIGATVLRRRRNHG
ncbi:hypothetical protein ACFXD5_13195 [Streptomyces sp. NPDC059385]|uniref:hypothetical protein n=1 Tax=Streptomyces sp. NPDC059385 TaxID=3346817 RepID=UPI0036D1D7F5